MCGVCGFVSRTSLDAAKMVTSLRHRGPDDRGSYQSVIAGQRVFLGHTRLSILDLSSLGHQPMSDESGEMIISYNGEIYNFESLKAQYLSKQVFRSRTDTEVLLYLYKKFGISFVELLNGDFAFALLDAFHDKLFLVRDRIGVKPLYYFHDDDRLIFASEIKSILESGVQPELAAEQLPLFFAFKYVPGANTLIKGVKRLMPGQFMEYDLKTQGIRLKTYWEIGKNTDYQGISYEEAKAVLYDLTKDAVEMRLMADVPVGTFFSGGVDSSIIVSFLKDRPEFTHFTAQKSALDLKKEGTTSDFAAAQSLAQAFSLRLVSVPIGITELNTELLRKCLFFGDDLIADGSQIPSYLITRHASRDCKVMLSGMGADELFLGYAGHLLTLLSHEMRWLPTSPSRVLTAGLSRLSQGRGRFKAYRRYLHKFGKYHCYPNYRYGLFNIVGDFETSVSVQDHGRESAIDFIASYFVPNGDPFHSVTRYEIENFLVKNLHYLDRMCMANSVEGRVPFLDHRLVDLALNLPREWKLSNTGVTKKILKETFQGHLPNFILKRRKAGFGMPLRSIFSSQQKIAELLDREFFSNFDSFDLTNINSLIDNHVSGREDNSSIIFALISFQEWYKLFLS